MGSAQVGSEEDRLTRKQRRELARRRRRAQEQAHAAGEARRRRLLQLAAVVAAAALGVGAVLIATGVRGGARVEAGSAGAGQVDAAVSSLLAGIPQDGEALGRPQAPVTLQYYGDLECPFCRQFTLTALPALIQRWVRSGRLRVEYHSLETATREPEVFRSQQLAALAAGSQHRLWNFIETFYREQGEEDTGYVTERFIDGIAKQVPGLLLPQWTSERGDPRLAAQLASDAQSANGAGVGGTPTLLIGRTGGAAQKLEPGSFTDPAPFNEAIEKLLAS